MRAWASVLRLGSAGSCARVSPARLNRSRRFSGVPGGWYAPYLGSTTGICNESFHISSRAGAFGSSKATSSPVRFGCRDAARQAHLVAAASLSVAESEKAHCESLPPVKAKQQSVRDRVALAQLGVEAFDLDRWRAQSSDRRWRWGDAGAEEEASTSGRLDSGRKVPGSLAECAVLVLSTPDPAEKIAISHAAWRRHTQQQLPIGNAEPPDEPARPALPKRVPAKQVPKPKESGVPLGVYMLLNLAHIELNAIDLAWDTVARFSAAGLPEGFYADFAHVADDESRHLGWCLQRLAELGHSYGELPAHNMLWEGAQLSAGELMGRLVLVPCSQEARGLDAGPRLVERLMSLNDHRSAAIVDRISQEELAHVAVGTFWFRRLCSALAQDSGDAFRRWLAALCPSLSSGQFNHPARALAGLEETWYDAKHWPEGLLADGAQTPQGLGDLDPQHLALVCTRLKQMLDVETSMA